MNQKILRAYNLLQDIQGKCLSSADDHMVLAVTGSCARGDDTDGSDLDAVLIIGRKELLALAPVYHRIYKQLVDALITTPVDSHWLWHKLMFLPGIVTIEALREHIDRVPYFYAPPLIDLGVIGTDKYREDLEYVRHRLLTKYRGAMVNWAFPDNVSDKAKQTFDRFQQQAEDYARK